MEKEETVPFSFETSHFTFFKIALHKHLGQETRWGYVHLLFPIVNIRESKLILQIMNAISLSYAKVGTRDRLTCWRVWSRPEWWIRWSRRPRQHTRGQGRIRILALGDGFGIGRRAMGLQVSKQIGWRGYFCKVRMDWERDGDGEEADTEEVEIKRLILGFSFKGSADENKKNLMNI